MKFAFEDHTEVKRDENMTIKENYPCSPKTIGTAVIMYKLWRTVRLNPFHLQICIVTHYTVLRTFSKVPTGRICFKIKSYFC